MSNENEYNLNNVFSTVDAHTTRHELFETTMTPTIQIIIRIWLDIIFLELSLACNLCVRKVLVAQIFITHFEGYLESLTIMYGVYAIACKKNYFIYGVV